MLLTLVYLAGLLFRPQRRVLGMGIDSLVVLVLYAIGVAGLFAIAQPLPADGRRLPGEPGPAGTRRHPGPGLNRPARRPGRRPPAGRWPPR